MGISFSGVKCGPCHRRSSTSACTANTRSPTAWSASTTRSRRPRTRMPALAMTDLANLFGMVKFYKAARGKGVKPIARLRRLDHQRRRSRQAVAPAAAVRSRARLSAAVQLLTQAYRSNQHRGRAEIRKEWLRESGTDGPDRLVGRASRRCRPGTAVGQPAAIAERWPREWAELFPQRFYIEMQRAGQPQAEHARQARGRACRQSASCRWWRPIRCNS